MSLSPYNQTFGFCKVLGSQRIGMQQPTSSKGMLRAHLRLQPSTEWCFDNVWCHKLCPCCRLQLQGHIFSTSIFLGCWSENLQDLPAVFALVFWKRAHRHPWGTETDWFDQIICVDTAPTCCHQQKKAAYSLSLQSGKKSQYQRSISPVLPAIHASHPSCQKLGRLLTLKSRHIL